MSLSEIDIMQTEQIEALQDDVKELRDKLNLLVTDITHATNGLTKKLNDAIDDADDLNDIINAGYSVASNGGAANTGILKRMDELFQELQVHRYTYTSFSQTGSLEETHPPASGTAPSGFSTVTCNLSGTAQGSSTRPQHTSVAQSVTATTPSYTTDSESVVTLKNTSEIRARKISRTLLGKVR